MLYHLPTGVDYQTVRPAVGSNTLRSLSRDTAVLLSDLTQGASNWIQSLLDPSRTLGGTRSLSPTPRSPQPIEARSTSAHTSAANCEGHMDYPEGFEPLRSECLAFVSPTSCPIIRNPFVSPLLAPCDLLRGLPPVHIVVREGSWGLNQLLNQFFMILNYCTFRSVPVYTAYQFYTVWTNKVKAVVTKRWHV